MGYWSNIDVLMQEKERRYLSLPEVRILLATLTTVVIVLPWWLEWDGDPFSPLLESTCFLA